MNDFTISKNGYDVLEVDSFITMLKNDYENKLAEQKDRIFYLKDQIEKLTSSSEGELMASLVKTVEKAKQIENSSKNIYELETKRLQLFYLKMESMIEEITSSQTQQQIKDKLMNLINDFKSTLNQNITMQNGSIANIEYSDPVRRLLSKMTTNNVRLKDITPAETIISQINTTPISSTLPTAATIELIKKDKLEVKKEQIKRPAEQKIKAEPLKTIEPAFENFLNEEDDVAVGKNFESIMFKKKNKKNQSVITGDLKYPEPNESGFDLKAAINPKDDLSEIMKAFDFFNGEEEKPKKKK